MEACNWHGTLRVLTKGLFAMSVSVCVCVRVLRSFAQDQRKTVNTMLATLKKNRDKAKRKATTQRFV